MQKKGHLIVISGPTCIGKSSLAIKVATKYGCPIISTDSRQFYREMNIGTAKPTPEELAKTKHYFIDSHSIQESTNASAYEIEANKLIASLLEVHPVLVATGGTGLYINALCDGFDNIPDVSDCDVLYYEKLCETKGIEHLQQLLATADPEYYEEVDLDNSRRVIRALSVIRSTGKPFSAFLLKEKKDRPYDPIFILLEMEREQLYNRINKRVDQMVINGLIEEAKMLYPQKGLKSLDTVGYQEFFASFDGKYDQNEAIRLIKRNSRRYAKRQMTWFRREDKWNRFDAADEIGILGFLESQIRR